MKSLAKELIKVQILQGVLHILKPMRSKSSKNIYFVFSQSCHLLGNWITKSSSTIASSLSPAASRPQFVTSAHENCRTTPQNYAELLIICPHKIPSVGFDLQPPKTTGDFPALRVKAWDAYFLSAAYQWSPGNSSGGQFPVLKKSFTLRSCNSFLWKPWPI